MFNQSVQGYPVRSSNQTESCPVGPVLLRTVRAGFVQNGTTLSGWCRDHNVNRGNATVALLGGWRGPKANKLIFRIKKAAGVS
jgi:hypothetical protein